MAKNKLEETLNEANDELGLALSTIGTHAKENNKKFTPKKYLQGEKDK